MLIFYHLFKCNSASSFMSEQIFVIYVNTLRILWVRMILCDMCLSYTFADSTLQCSQMKQEIIFNDNTLQEQHLYKPLLSQLSPYYKPRINVTHYIANIKHQAHIFYNNTIIF